MTAVDHAFWRGRRVFLTGHTGFKGGWLSLWLSRLGAEVHGYSLAPATRPSLFEEARLVERLSSHRFGDVRNGDEVAAAMRDARPNIVIHMAAQPLVRLSYRKPVETYATNVMGTVNVLEAARQLGNVSALVNVTTDKCYENREWHWGYRETEQLGGLDPYSNSKACSELVTAAYRASFHREGGPWIASARAGNVIGGGDWADDRLIPDILRSLDDRRTLEVRSPGAVRPWQHVLEPLSGYLTLAQHLVEQGQSAAAAWNFGPSDDDARPVGWILDHIRALKPELSWRTDQAVQVHEANVLKLDSAKAKALLRWRPHWSLPVALTKTIEWHHGWKAGEDVATITDRQIAEYEAAAPDA